MISKFFIERPVLSNVLALVIVLIGAVAVFTLPIAQYPNVVPPTVVVTTTYPGASARTIMDTVALPIEEQVNGVQGMIYMQSTSASDGTYNLTVTFDIGTDPDQAQVLVQNRVAIALASLPESVQVQGVNVQKKSTAVLQFITLFSPDNTYDGLYLSNYGVINIQNELARIPGVGNVIVNGAGPYAMRIWMDPDKLQAFGLTPTDVVDAIRKQSQEVTAGMTGMPPAPKGLNFQYTVNVNGRFNDAPDFENIIVKVNNTNGGQIVRVRDIGRVELGSQSYSHTSTFNNAPTAAIGIFQLPEANALGVAEAVRAKMEELSKAFPPGLQYEIPFDTTRFVSASIDEVYKTLIEAAILVLIVILVFLQDWRAVLVPATTVPVTIIGAFAAMAALGFSVNTATLFAIVLAIGIVVDDAIVIVEGVSRHIEEGKSGHDAAIKAMDELFGPIIGITLVLMAVFLPSSFLPGLTGQMYKQFALVIAATAFISAINAATLKPTQCALWLRAPTPREKRNIFFRGFNRVFDWCEQRYVGLIRHMVKVSYLMVLAALILVGTAFWGMSRIPTAFLPIEDQGYVVIAVQLPEGASLQRTDAVMKQVSAEAKATPGVENVIAISGVSVLDNSATLFNSAVLYVVLKDWSVRGPDESLKVIYEKLTEQLSGLQEATGYVLVPPPIQGIGNTGGFTMEVLVKNGSSDFHQLQAAVTALEQRAATQTGLQRVNSSFSATTPQLTLKVNRILAETLGVTVGQVFSTIEAYLGSTYVNQFTKFNNVFQVYVQAAPESRVSPQDVMNLKVQTKTGEMVPLGTLVSFEDTDGPPLITLYNLYPAATLAGGAAPGFSSGQAMSLMEQIAEETLPPGYGIDWTAMSYQEKIVGNDLYFAFGLAIVLVYFVLAGQYESWLLPFAVLLAVPLALLGTVIALTAVGAANNLYTQIGIILLIALAAKNAILIVEYARDQRNEGMEIVEAAVQAARLRFRPILMTSFAFILGVMPLVFATGAGAASRRSIGISVVSGMLASTCLAVLFVPSFYVVIQRLAERGKKGKPAALPPQEPIAAAE
ncbi:multidrug efflux RND transporter permease subunit [Kaistia geumhonensis]|uniref:Efflux pump membrane transporter n=1 Tax=Kaistia geumhonensis TaxID=410839 RepID=A0ABU0M1Z6_9HYPH|nr:multidrug efflux RND transporter permease subunit [Kaistia geumhonensis]MCX5479802.1 multidrug efflux RND transporter permease subunit [Kaistia geumhonensis]MDQ0514973.1 HAE1 family hydrophobic/amphiphilic exporter-1 [Kaistia geumhonensis]